MISPGNISLEKAVAYLDALKRVAQMTSSSRHLDDILKTILQETMRLTDSIQGALLSLLNDQPGHMHTLFKTAEQGSGKMDSAFSDMIGGWVFQHRTHLVIDHFSQDRRFEHARKWFPTVGAVLAVPMQLQNQINGILILSRNQRFDENEVALMNIVASQCAQLLENARHFQKMIQENQILRREVQRRYQFHEIIGNSPAMQRIFDLLERIIPGESRVLLTGESGTGKELIARVIHFNGPRREGKFLAVDCGALPESLLESELFGHLKGAFTGAISDKKGLFELAHRGTLFLDEIGNTSPVFQSKLLRAVQEGEIRPVGSEKSVRVDVRIIAATSQPLHDQIASGEFREDLFYRLNIINLELPPLRERWEDIPLLVHHFLQKYTVLQDKSCQGISAEALRMLENYRWPGNIRELENAIERAVALALPDEKWITPDLLPEQITRGALSSPIPDATALNVLPEAIEALEKQMILDALQKHSGNRSHAAEVLGITRQTLISKIKKYGINTV
jgi:Nif-specific regulatory protein